MPRQCASCEHPQVVEINAALSAGESVSRVAERFGVSRHSLYRHRDNHLPIALSSGFDVPMASDPQDLAGRLGTLASHAESIRARAEKAGNLRVALQAVRELTNLVELAAKLRGELPDGRVSVVMLAEWPAILAALTPYPDARLAVNRALRAGG